MTTSGFYKRKKWLGGKQGQNGEKQGLTTLDLTLPITIILEQAAGGQVFLSFSCLWELYHNRSEGLLRALSKFASV